jgi:hypothetical protein
MNLQKTASLPPITTGTIFHFHFNIATNADADD